MTREPANQNEAASQTLFEDWLAREIARHDHHRHELADALRGLREAAVELIRVIELETSGIRDGDGYWHGSDGLTGRIDEVTSIGNRVEALRQDVKLANAKQASLLDDEFPF